MDPLSQFSVYALNSDYMYYGSLTNSSLFFYVIIGSLVLVMLFPFYYETSIYFSLFFYIVRKIYMFVFDYVQENLGLLVYNYFFFILFTFYVLLIANLIGMIPCSFTITSHIIVTFYLSFAFFFGLNFIGIRNNGFQFLALFFPSGAPLLIAPLLVAIETISYIARVFSLAIRLFANMMSGHTLLKILSNFCLILISQLGIWFILGSICGLLILIVTGLELAIAFLQAYVFTVLLCIYIRDAIYLH